jgi:hypothetical protein
VLVVVVEEEEKTVVEVIVPCCCCRSIISTIEGGLFIFIISSLSAPLMIEDAASYAYG